MARPAVMVTCILAFWLGRFFGARPPTTARRRASAAKVQAEKDRKEREAAAVTPNTRLAIYWPADKEFYPCVVKERFSDGRLSLLYDSARFATTKERFPQSTAIDPEVRRILNRTNQNVQPWNPDEAIQEVHRRGY
jgi:hypothetical protein